MSSIRLHPTLGVNPKLVCCFYCGKEKNELVLLGAYHMHDKALQENRHVVVDQEPCEWCKRNMQKGIVLVEATGGSGEATRPTGCYAVLTVEAVKRFLQEPVLDAVLKKRIAFLDSSTWNMIALRGIEKAEEPTT